MNICTMKETEAIVNGVTITLTEDQLNHISSQFNKGLKEQRFLELISNIDISKPRIDFGKYPNRIFWFDSNGDYMFEYDWKSGGVWTNHDKVWSVFHVEYPMKYIEVEAFIRAMVEEHFKLNGVTPSSSIMRVSAQVEEHFKLNRVT